MNYPKLVPEVKTAWLKALRSGKYDQTRGGLHHTASAHSSRPEGWCCLGVACDIAEIPMERSGDKYEVESFDGADTMPPTTVIAWMFGIAITEFEDPYGEGVVEIDRLLSLLAKMNDNDRKSFGEIADWVEVNL